jgi:gamma-glutamyltranspeptidase
MGGDVQPQIVAQLLDRLLRLGESPGRAVRAGRWVLGAGPATPEAQRGGFDLWDREGPGHIAVEAHAPRAWDAGLAERGHAVQRSTQAIEHGFGHAQIIEVSDGVLAGVADHRSLDGAASGY